MTAGHSPTDWTPYDVPTLATFVTYDYEDAWGMVFAWRIAHESISEHHAQLAKAQAELAEAWPSDHSPAAAAYLDYVESLRTSMSSTAEVAMTNSTALANILEALNNARSTIDLLHGKWKLYVSPGTDGAGTSTHSPADTVSATWSKKLNAQARQTTANVPPLTASKSPTATIPPTSAPGQTNAQPATDTSRHTPWLPLTAALAALIASLALWTSLRRRRASQRAP